MADFTQQIKNFVSYGTYNYALDEVGNEVLNPSSSIFQQVYFALPLENYVYDDSKILSFYDPTFTEFVPPTTTGSTSTLPQEVLDQINTITAENLQLQSQLEALVASAEQNPAIAEQQSIKDTILSLRIQLGQGQTSADFSNEYPYLPIPFEDR